MKPSSREDYLPNEGCVLFTAVNERVLETIGAPPAPLPQIVPPGRHAEHGVYHADQDTQELLLTNPAGASLYFVMFSLIERLPKNDTAFREQHHVTDTDIAHAEKHDVFEGGFSDLDFPFYFTAQLANEVTDFFIEQHVLSEEQKRAFTLRDWADLISADWFSHLVHRLAFTSRRTHERRGKFLEDHYTKDSLHNALANLPDGTALTPGTPLFAYKPKLDRDTGLCHATAVPSGELSRFLKKRGEESYPNGSIPGCPVARLAISLTPEQLRNPHAEQLVSKGRLVAAANQPNPGRTRFMQEHTAIDDTLAFFASQLEAYDELYGTPRATLMRSREGCRLSFEHLHNKPVDALRWPINTNNRPILGRTALSGD